jgi:hypothetical protein
MTADSGLLIKLRFAMRHRQGMRTNNIEEMRKNTGRITRRPAFRGRVEMRERQHTDSDGTSNMKHRILMRFFYVW